MSDSKAPAAYSLIARVLHWITAVLVLTTIPIGFVMANVSAGALQDSLYVLHRSIGTMIIPLIIARLGYRLMHPPLPLPDDIPPIQQFAAHATHWGQKECVAEPNEAGLHVDVPILRESLPAVMVERAQERRGSRAEHDQIRLPLLQQPSGNLLVRGVGDDRLYTRELARQSREPCLVARQSHDVHAACHERLHDAAFQPAATTGLYGGLR